jgi:hypothetical protein
LDTGREDEMKGEVCGAQEEERLGEDYRCGERRGGGDVCGARVEVKRTDKRCGERKREEVCGERSFADWG